MRKAFTLIELLVVIAIIGTIAAVGAVSIIAGEDAAHLKGGLRDVLAAIRRGRTLALVTQNPAVVVYSQQTDGETVHANVEVNCVDLLKNTEVKKAWTIGGREVTLGGDDDEAEKDNSLGYSISGVEQTGESKTKKGHTVEEIINKPIDPKVLEGIRIKVLREDESLDPRAEEERKSQISVFSNVDFLERSYGSSTEKSTESETKSASKKDEKKSCAADKSVGSGVSQDKGLTEPFKVVWETNGRCDPHRVYLYADGMEPEDGYCIKVDKFGSIKVLDGDEDE